MSKEFYKVKQLTKYSNIEDRYILKKDIINIINKNSINVRLNKLKIQLDKIEKKLLSNLELNLL